VRGDSEMQDVFWSRQNSKDLHHGAGREMEVSLPCCKSDCNTTQFNDSGGDKVLQGFSITDKEFYQLAAYIKSNYGIHLKNEKKALVTSRLHNVLLDRGLKNFSEYYDYILSDQTGNAVATLINKITTNHTFFMREADHFNYFQDKVLPYFANVVESKDLRIWSAGCSTGEEPYTLAMIIDEYFGKEKVRWDTKILATDISGKVLEAAAKGIYDNKEISTLPAKWKLEYFKQLDSENSIIVDRIRNEVIYRRFNLMDRVFPFKRKFHVIFCRNVMIYFDAKTKIELTKKFYDMLELGGYLFIGHSESINREQTRFKYIRPAVYRKE
jgi:chemotaxis protein methyltransferase CheR